jgi:formamidopyrimidine-DNA glycosylase
MPELPEVETIRRDLIKVLPGHAVQKIDVRDRRLMSATQESHFREVVIGQRWQSIERKGKYLVARLVNSWEIIFHLRMTGQLVIKTKAGIQKTGILDKPIQENYRMLLTFDHGIGLAFFDQRRFGEVWLKGPADPWPGKTTLGPDPLDELDTESFVTMVRKHTTRIKPLLMDQRFLAGVGNIYAQEALFKAAIRPTRPANRISRQEAGSLYKALRETLLSAIDHRGSTARNYRDAFGQSGSAQSLHTVYDRGGEPCLNCRRPLRASRVGGRGTVYCSTCQR